MSAFGFVLKKLFRLWRACVYNECSNPVNMEVISLWFAYGTKYHGYSDESKL
jgi:hypothetical protein